MADQEVISNGNFLQDPVVGSNDTLPPKKKRNLPGNPGKFSFKLVLLLLGIFFFFV